MVQGQNNTLTEKIKNAMRLRVNSGQKEVEEPIPKKELGAYVRFFPNLVGYISNINYYLESVSKGGNNDFHRNMALREALCFLRELGSYVQKGNYQRGVYEELFNDVRPLFEIINGINKTGTKYHLERSEFPAYNPENEYPETFVQFIIWYNAQSEGEGPLPSNREYNLKGII